MTCDHPATTPALDRGRAARCLACGHRVLDYDRRGRAHAPRQTRYTPSRWLTEWRRRWLARSGRWLGRPGALTAADLDPARVEHLDRLDDDGDPGDDRWVWL